MTGLAATIVTASGAGAAADGVVSTVAGNGTFGFGGTFLDGPREVALLYQPSGVSALPDGSLYVADYGNDRIRKVAPDGTVSTVAGNGTRGFADGPGATAQFNGPNGISALADGTLYVADYGNNRIRKVAPDGTVSTVAGSGASGFADGPGAVAQFAGPTGVSALADGTLYVADNRNHRIRRIAPDGTVSTVAGTSPGGFADGPGATARFNLPYGVSALPDGTVYVAEFVNNRIRRVAPDGTVSTVAGTGTAGYLDGLGAAAQFRSPTGVSALPDGTVYVTDYLNHRVRRITPDGTVSTVAGDGSSGYLNGPASAARFSNPVGISAHPDGQLYVADLSNHRIRLVLAPADTTPPTVTIESGAEALGNDATPTFTFSADEPATFECAVASGGATPTTYAACTSPHTTAALADGEHTVAVRATDAGGNTSTPVTATFTVDTTAPGAPTVDLESASDTGLSDVDDVTADATPTFTGTAEAASTVRVTVGPGALAPTGADGGTYTVTSGLLALGPHAVTATATDAAGNVSPPSAALTITVVAPTACHTATNRITGTAGLDVLSGTAGADLLLGLGGGDDLAGLGGADCAVGGGGNDRLKGGAGNDELRGDEGGDRISADGGADTVLAGSGDDNVDSVDGVRDTIDCGTGTQDAVTADRLDVLTGCERVTRR